KAYETQNAKGLVSCPVCRSTEIDTALSTVGISRYRRREPSPPQITQEEVYRFIEDNFEDVGTDFAREALKIHYKVTESRNIRGVSTEQEEKTLEEEGISFFKFPIIPPPFPDDDKEPQDQ
ncbi:MAG: DUF1178 family protein, partial [Candidatus Adiutricales bacterium]